jgi:hypothetical protein
MTPDELMLAAKNKYDLMVEKGTWNTPTAEEKIVALEAKLETTVKNLNKKVSFELGKKTGEKKTVDKSKKKKGSSKLTGHPKTWSQPKQGDKKEAEYKGYAWYWCGKDTGGKCEKWRAHKPKECKGGAQASSGGKREATTETSSDKGNKKEKLAKKLKIAKAYVARIEKQASEVGSSGEETE